MNNTQRGITIPEQAVWQLRELRTYCEERQEQPVWRDNMQSLDIAIKALEKEPVLARRPCKDCGKINENNKAEFIGQIIDVFEDFLESKGINIPNDEKTDDDNPAIIYGTDYGEIQTDLEELLQYWSKN